MTRQLTVVSKRGCIGIALRCGGRCERFASAGDPCGFLHPETPAQILHLLCLFACPEPTTDKFTVVMHGQDDRAVEGSSLTVIKELPYGGLARFGTG